MIVGPVTVSFERPTQLMSMNDRIHWSVDRRRARAWRQATGWAAIDQLGTTPAARRKGPSIVTVTLPVHSDRDRDPHNFFKTVKHVIDGLVDAGLWPDDTPEWVTTTEPHLELTKERPGLVSVAITPRDTSEEPS